MLRRGFSIKWACSAASKIGEIGEVQSEKGGSDFRNYLISYIFI